MINNYLKTDRQTGYVIFLFDDRMEESREAAYKRATEIQPNPERLSIWRGDGRDRAYVSRAMFPISDRVPVVGQSKKFYDLP